MMTNDEHEGRIFRSHPRTNNRFFFLHTVKYGTFIFKNLGSQKFLNMLGCDIYQKEVTLTCNDVTCLSMCSCSIFIFPTGWYGICEIELSQMG